MEQVARLIRSKGVSVWFISQNPADIPEDILGQLGNRVQHALRAFTAKDQKALRLAAENYRPNPEFDIAEAIQSVGTGEAVTSLLEAKGIPGIAQRCLIRPPFSRLGPVEDAERAQIMQDSPLREKYTARLERESAKELLQKRAEAAAAEVATEKSSSKDDDLFDMARPEYKNARRYEPRQEARPRSRSSRSDSVAETFAKSLARQLGTKSGQALVRGVLGSLFRGR